MKKIVIACVALFFVSCSAGLIVVEDVELQFNTIDEIWDYTSTIEYKARPDGVYYWQFPKETFELNSGICADYCTMFQYLAEKAGYNVTILLMTDGEYLHSIVKYDGMYIEPQVKNKYFNMNKWEVKVELDTYAQTLLYKSNAGY